MKVKEFNYIKKDGKKNNYKIMILNEDVKHINGIDFNKLKIEEIKMIESIQNEYEQKLKPYMKAYRSFIKENIING
jgi:hypothetical protein